MMRADIFLNFIFLVIREKGELYLSLESITSIKKTYKPAKGSLSSSQLFVTSLHTSDIDFLQTQQFLCTSKS